MYYVKLESGLVIETERLDLWSEGTRISATEGRRLLKAEAIKHLKRYLKPGNTVYTILRHCSSSGMSRRINVYAVHKKEIVDLSYWAARALDRVSKNCEQGITMGGCDMDMGFDLVYELGCALWPKGTRRPHGTRNGEPDHAGGYALKQRWL